MIRLSADQGRLSSIPAEVLSAPRSSWHVLALAVLLGGTMMHFVKSADAQGDPLARYRWKARVLVVLAADLDSPALAEQRRQIESLGSGAAERGLVLVEPAAGSAEAGALRTRFGLGDEAFQAVLVGKDGGAKLHATKPISARELMATVDAMPMRQDELRQRPRSP